MENNQRFIKIIQSAGIELYEELKNGNILAVNLYDNDMSWEIKLQFNNWICPDCPGASDGSGGVVLYTVPCQ